MQILSPGVKPQTPNSVDVERTKLCDVSAADPTIVNAEFYRHYVYAADGTSIVSQFDTDIDGNVYTIVGVAAECPTATPAKQYDIETKIMCDNLGDGTKPTPVCVVIAYDRETGDVFNTTYTTLEGVPTAITGNLERCPEHKQLEQILGSESIDIFVDSPVALTVPANSQYAIIQNISDDPVYFAKDGTALGVADGTEGFRLDSCGTIKLGCDPQSGGAVIELDNFSAIGTSGRLQVCYFGCI